MKDWEKWHEHYDADESSLKQRLILVQNAIRQCLPRQLKTAYTILDICAGDGRDLINVLNSYEHKDLVRGRLIELDPHLADKAQKYAKEAQLPNNLKIIQDDASSTHAYKNDIPADLILICGVFGNISDTDIRKTIQYLPRLCKQGTKIIWTRHRRAPDITQTIRDLFLKNNFTELKFMSTDNNAYGVGIYQFSSTTPKLGKDVTMFSFIK